MIFRDNVPHEPGACGGDDNPVCATVSICVLSADQSTLLEAIHQPGDIRSMHDQSAAKVDLRHPVRFVADKVQYVELAGAKIPTREEEPAGIP